MDDQLFQKQQAQQPAQQLTTLATKLRLAEERYKNLQKRNHLTEDSLLSFERDVRAELNVLKTRMTEARKHILDVNTTVDSMMAELQNVVQRHEFKALQRYVELWQPMNWVTVEEAKRLMEEK